MHVFTMRTTLTLDDDLADILLRETKKKGVSCKETLNATLRRGLEQEQIGVPRKQVVTRPHHFGFKVGVDLNKLNQLADQLEAEAVADKLSRPR